MLLKLPSVTLANICDTNSHNRRAKGQPGVGIVKIFCDSISSGSKSFRLLDSDSAALMERQDISPGFYSLLQNSQPATASVGRSFSMLKKLLT